MVYCQPCGRYFSSQNGYNQHVENSNAHRNVESSDSSNYAYYPSDDEEPDFECDGCYKHFWSTNDRENHHVSAHGDRYCKPCKRMFMSANNLIQHQHSKIHMGLSIKCPFCSTQYPTASALIIHLESGRCPSGMNRERINAEIRRLDRNHVITTRQIEYPSSPSTSIATERSWNGYCYECPLCSSEFNTLPSLNAHLRSPFHEQKIYRCPGPKCGREFKLLSGLVMHVESESCGVMRFQNVQRGAKSGIANMVGKMIGN
ncbi:hypothetical protein NHQ30_006076 [Ciborinia camelliae]|nr:hypothetical protein NHQ30_006076 [Ciborinia camelliae]